MKFFLNRGFYRASRDRGFPRTRLGVFPAPTGNFFGPGLLPDRTGVFAGPDRGFCRTGTGVFFQTQPGPGFFSRPNRDRGFRTGPVGSRPGPGFSGPGSEIPVSDLTRPGHTQLRWGQGEVAYPIPGVNTYLIKLIKTATGREWESHDKS